ncbi:MAG: hypothetical protein DU429_03085 [Candidatus Tokpelaia sp.]|nr:MAG: hypothetical protein DU430_05830 [Candidatus Tokpelaia sp.]KAA6207447.1 MAG: hypothetical protein DU429_03085 [Candidatus Tokpelaia sp.]
MAVDSADAVRGAAAVAANADDRNRMAAVALAAMTQRHSTALAAAMARGQAARAIIHAAMARRLMRQDCITGNDKAARETERTHKTYAPRHHVRTAPK